MDKRKSFLNVIVSVTLKVVTLVLALLTKRFLIQACGNEVNGLNSLYLSVVGFLAVAELGVGSAITFCMYKPIVEGDTRKVSALYRLFRNLYLAIGAVVLCGGLVLMPFLHLLAKDYAQLQVDLYSTFLLMLLSVVVTYLFGAKTALFNAYKNNYITTAITSGGMIGQQLLQIGVLLLTGSFAGYLMCRIVSALGQWLITELIARRRYGSILRDGGQPLDKASKTELTAKIRAMFMHKTGHLLVTTLNSVIISAMVGVAALGKFSNYSMIQDSLVSVLGLGFTSLTSVIGHLYAKQDKHATERYARGFHLINFAVGTLFFLGYYAVIDNLVALLFSHTLVLPKTISFVIAMNGFVQFMRQSTVVFRDATGTFYNDRWKPLVEGLVNVALSIVLVRYVGMVGVLGATIVTNLLICHVVEPYVLYRHALALSPAKYYIRNYGMILLFGGALLLLDGVMISGGSQWSELLVNGLISVGVALLTYTVVAVFHVDLLKKLLKKAAGYKKKANK